MRELRSCDFCGAEAIGAFEIVPPELEPTESEQRRVVPCRDCKERLETLIDPLLARAGAERGPDAADRDRDATDGEHDGSGAVVASADESTEKRRRTTSPNATVSDASAEPDERSTARDDEETEADPGSDSGSQSESTSDSLLEEGITFERNERADSEETDGGDAAGTGDGGTEPVTAAADDSTDRSTQTSDDSTERPTQTSDAESSSGDGDAATESSTRPPTAYNKVVRLLRNREFPMQRSAVEELAAGAYDLESREVEAIVDYAVADGEFVEKGGELRRP
ncbi:MSCRAMM family adhesin SdrC [Natrinema amylolyticum]|uniref:MSCRAMM family adhesin SdrC n=1 Tax=Natrinema amylolyticum TaxID=2878679 RepID=UPI001CFA6660|nr:MSCRAMM family adhesin SdrC [Natrinema amylolyticum]